MFNTVGIYNDLNRLRESSNDVSNSYSKLSSGKKNLIKESPADYHIAKGLEERVRNSEIAMRNISTGSNMLAIADGSVQSSIDRLIELKKEALLYNDGSHNSSQKNALLDRMNSIGSEIMDILNTTQFNGYDILNTESFEFQVGSDSIDKLEIEFDISNLDLTFTEDIKVDLAIIMDNSGSLGEEQAGIENNLQNLVNELESENIDLALGLTRFGASANGGDPIVGELTTDTDDFINTIWDQNTLDGSVEPTYDAIEDTANNMAFRTGSNRYLMVVGDENPDQGNSGQNEALIAINSINGKLITVTEPGYYNDFETITNGSDGITIDINDDFSTVITEVKNQIMNSAKPDFLTQIEDNLSILLKLSQNIGRTINRLDNKEMNLSTHILNTEKSRSRIEDIDFAKESMNQMKAEILMQSSNQILKQRIDSMSYILKLFG
jgi:flagellin